MASWYYAKDGAQLGPVDEGTFASLVESGVVQRHTLVWRPGMTD